ncbi:hypothetical protein D3OALGB2SA_5510 [Olavius algarvensis associated proteobacterium Delta 3]|nr:hypothetical protein D3OALGB2SA_5510 [Olavius algarvensis associated proteobacterium Delta 3]
MADRKSGLLHVENRITLNTVSEVIEVITLPLQAGIGWEAITAQAVQHFSPYDGQCVTLEGDLHGGILASARIVTDCQEPVFSIRNGTYHGRIESTTGEVLYVDLRMDGASEVISADFFRDGLYYASTRTRAQKEGESWIAPSPRFIFNTDTESEIGGHLEVTPSGAATLQVDCLVPEALPNQYTGEISFQSEHFRVLNIEVDKLDGMPWPPEYSTRDIPPNSQPSDLEEMDISLSSLFRQAGVETRIHFNDGALAADIGASAGRPWEGDRWDERELHEMMDTNYSRSLNDREWWLYLLIVTRFDGGPETDNSGYLVVDDQGLPVNSGIGTTGIIFDHSTGNIRDPWAQWTDFIATNYPQYLHLFDFGRGGAFGNSRARQGVAVFWSETLDFLVRNETWYRDRQFLRTIVHELGHALNLAHTWLVGRADTTSFMNYPHRYPHGGSALDRILNYWRDFDYAFDPEELFHLKHGFYDEIVPGGRMEFMEWSPTSVFRDPNAGGTRANLALGIEPTKELFRFTEPVTVNIRVYNHSSEPVPFGRLSPSYGDVVFLIRKPSGGTVRYRPLIYKCQITKETIANKETKTHLTSLAVGSEGFIFDTPGRYEITAMIPDPSSGIMVVARPSTIWVKYPEGNDENVAKVIFDREPALYLYMGGGHHLKNGSAAMEEVVARFPDHPFAAHANLVLGLDKVSGQKKRCFRNGPVGRSHRRNSQSAEGPRLRSFL